MRTPAVRKTANRLYTKSIPAPIEGWDTSSPLQAMSPKRAIALENWFPEQAYCRIRRGHILHAQTFDDAGTPVALTTPVETLMAYNGLTANKLFAAAGAYINDVTGATDGTAAVNSLANARFQYINFTTSGGKFLYAVNGADLPQLFNGSAWSEPTITGISAEDAIGICGHKHRIWFVMNESTKAAYLPIDSIQGAATEFDLGSIFTKGGFLMAIGTWTVDGGSGADDLLVFVSSRGQIAIYQGTDPSSSDTWQLTGVFDLGSPIGRRCLTKVGADLAYISIDGVVPLSKALALDRGAEQLVAITANIQPSVNDATVMHKDKFGWQLIGYPKGKAAFLNIPTIEGSKGMQFVMNTLSGAWAKYTGQNAICWEVMDDRIFFGGAGGKVFEADVGSLDNGAPISVKLKPAFNYFGSSGMNKHFKEVRPILTTNGQVNPSISMNTDFEDTDPSLVPVVISTDSPKWDEVQWDEFQWGSAAPNAQAEWVEAEGVGFCAAPNMRAQVSQETGLDVVLNVNGFDVRYEEAASV